MRRVIYLDRPTNQDPKKGFFHEWVTSTYDAVMAIVEDMEGRIELVRYTDIRFIDPPDSPASQDVAEFVAQHLSQDGCPSRDLENDETVVKQRTED